MTEAHEGGKLRPRSYNQRQPTHGNEEIMGQFRPLQYDPRQDSSPGAEDYHADRDAPDGSEAAAGFYPDETVILITADGTCACGCGQTPKGKTSNFCMGHDARLRGKLIRAHLMGYEVAVYDGGLVVSGPAMTFATNLGWECYLEDAERKESGRVQGTLERANARVLAKAMGPQIGEKRLVKVGRWEYSGQVIAFYQNGDNPELEVEYVTKSGEIKTMRQSALTDA